jgi:redox-sensitive bicupin YhaK (pirin superfamily)
MGASLLLNAHERDLGGGFRVRRVLPSAQRQSVGPFLFFDHFGPLQAGPQDNYDVRPHPHIGLATVTYLFDGALMHRDNLGSVQRIEPGAINWMTAGRGIVHSERTPTDLAGVARHMHGLQLWTGLPRGLEEAEPAFAHTPGSAIPSVERGRSEVRVLIGRAYGEESPVATLSETLYLDVMLPADEEFLLEPLAVERAIYPLETALRIDDIDVAAHTMAVVETGRSVRVRGDAATRFVVIGGAPLDGRRFLWWNFVSSRKDRIAQAAEDWAAQRMPHIPGETEWIPLPEFRL